MPRLPRSRWLRQLGVTDQLVEWVKPVRPPVHPPEWLTPALFAALPARLCVRELRYRVVQAGFRTQTVTLVTTLLEVDLYPADALAELYHIRWHREQCFEEGKTALGMAHDEVRKDPGWHHHLLTTMLAHFFLWHLKLRVGKKSTSPHRVAAADALGSRLPLADVYHHRGPGTRRVDAAA
jgi:hypothetical protein